MQLKKKTERNNEEVCLRKYLRMDISLQKSSMFSAVRSCSKKTLIATSVPFQMPRKTSPKNPKNGTSNENQLNELNWIFCFSEQ